jgi:pyrimidine-specific ribonucleoside hydrolase
MRSRMIKKRYIAFYALVLFCLFSHSAHAHIYKISVIIDTDMALDDVRAITMLLNSDMVDIPLIVTSDGVLSPQDGCKNLEMLLRYFKREDIKIARGRTLDKPAPPWRSWCGDLKWPQMEAPPFEIAVGDQAPEEIVKTLQSQDKPILYLCLGPLTNLADALHLNPGVKDKISRLVYFEAYNGDPLSGWNTSRDPESARFVFDSGLDTYWLSTPQETLLPFDQRLYEKIEDMNTPAARLVATVHSTRAIIKLLSEGHFRVWDEMAVIYLNEPSLFKFVPGAYGPEVMSLTSFKAAGIYDTYLKLLGHFTDFHLSPRHPVVLGAFPTDPSLFRDDVKPYVKKIIENYGLEEWKACLLTNEFHRHLGIYSLIGAKMGIRAREVLEAPFDAVRVVSYAGTGPPLSCMNDGLQVATGASLGRGTIQISNEKPRPEASFFYKDKKLTLKIKSELVSRVKSDIEAAEKEYSGLNPAYFAHIRKLSLDYWHDLDRRTIFEEFVAEAFN